MAEIQIAREIPNAPAQTALTATLKAAYPGKIAGIRTSKGATYIIQTELATADDENGIRQLVLNFDMETRTPEQVVAAEAKQSFLELVTTDKVVLQLSTLATVKEKVAAHKSTAKTASDKDLREIVQSQAEQIEQLTELIEQLLKGFGHLKRVA